MGLLASAVTRSQIAAMFFAMIGTLLPATQFAGLIDPVSSLEGSGVDRRDLPRHAHDLHQPWRVQQGAGPADLTGPLWSMLLSVPVILGVAFCYSRSRSVEMRRRNLANIYDLGVKELWSLGATR
jgi:ribosome-dependent ATPase